MTKKYSVLLSIFLLTFVTACGSSNRPTVGGIKIGKPYEVAGRTYVPSYQPTYDQVGTASWYGPGFHGGSTANGERYDQEAMTAAHKTLPLPSIVRVTNLDNGRSAIVRVNDRGPFVGSRIIDVSRAAAMKLGIYQHGTANVRVQYLDAETRAYVSNMPNGPASLARLDREAQRRSQAETVAVNTDTVDTGSGAIESQPLPFSAPEARVAAASAGAPAATYVQPAVYHPRMEPTVPPIRPVTLAESTSMRSAQGYFVQAGTFGVKGNADRLLQQLQSMGNAKIVSNAGGNRTLYRVLSGPYNSREEAQNMLSRLDTAGISGAKIIRD
ncbi:MAG TPA: septal ring lytic transglycosylase RlpA family protein [Rickettsiales bacterium]|nr:septal ring lytic transglycosylase RlpA family protein [Rickettsiales bacterium]